jgi:hypothetical protein
MQTAADLFLDFLRAFPTALRPDFVRRIWPPQLK